MPLHRLPPSSRSVAADVVARVLRDDAFAVAVLDAELDRNVQLDERDRAFATELAYGTLRFRGAIEARLAKHVPRGIDALEPHVRACLDVAAYQLLVLTRVPPFAAVNEAVEFARALRGAKVAGFVNAVLRRISSSPRPAPEELAREALAHVDARIVKSMSSVLGDDATLEMFLPTEPPPLGLRIENASDRDTWLSRFVEARPEATFERGKVSPNAILARGAGKVTELPGYGEGAWTPQEEGSQVVALSLGAKPGDVVLDACAGRGNKTGLLAASVSPGGAVDAADLHTKKLDRLALELGRIGRAPRQTFAVDWSAGKGGVTEVYDRILVDAPCSGTGTLRRRPELLLRRTMDDSARLSTLQRSILANVRDLLRPGGRLLYAVCTVLREEAEDVLAGASDLGLRPVSFDSDIARTLADENASFRLLPHRHGTDGYFLASFVRD